MPGCLNGNPAPERGMNMVSLKPVIEELEVLFDKFNKAFFEGKLEKPVITVSPDSTRGAYGWCTGWKAWKNGSEGEGFYEINLCAEYLNRPFEETCSTLIHEMCHLWNLQEGTQDTSRGGTYHNKRFKEAAETHGLTVEKTVKHGWNSTYGAMKDKHNAMFDPRQANNVCVGGQLLLLDLIRFLIVNWKRFFGMMLSKSRCSSRIKHSYMISLEPI